MNLKSKQGTLAFNSKSYCLGETFEVEEVMGNHLLEHNLAEKVEEVNHVKPSIEVPVVEVLKVEEVLKEATPADEKDVKESPELFAFTTTWECTDCHTVNPINAAKCSKCRRKKPK